MQNDLEPIFKQGTSLYDNVLLQGDLNCDMLCDDKGRPLQRIMDIYFLMKMIKNATFTTQHGQSLIYNLFNQTHFPCKNYKLQIL